MRKRNASQISTVENQNLATTVAEPTTTVVEPTLDINSIINTVAQRGKIIFQEVESRVLSSEFLCPELRHLYVNDNGSSSSRPEYNSVSGISTSLSYSPLIKRIIYFKKTFDTKYTTVSEDISSTSPFYRSVLRDINGHLLSVNSSSNNKYLPDIAVIQYKKITYENGFIERYPMITDYLMMPKRYWWEKRYNGQYDLELMDPERIAERKHWSTLYPNRHFDLYADFEELPISDYVSKFSMLCFFSIDLGGFGSFYAKLAWSFLKMCNERDFYIVCLKIEFIHCMEDLTSFINRRILRFF